MGFPPDFVGLPRSYSVYRASLELDADTCRWWRGIAATLAGAAEVRHSGSSHPGMVFCLVAGIRAGKAETGNRRVGTEGLGGPARPGRRTGKTGYFAMKRRILLVDDEVAILLTLQAVLEINGFEVETAASAREAKLKIRSNRYHMVITDMRMESEIAGNEVVLAARKSPHRPAVALLTAFPATEAVDSASDADEVLVKPMNTNDLLLQIEALLVTHEDHKRRNEERDAPFGALRAGESGRKKAGGSTPAGTRKTLSAAGAARAKAPAGEKATLRRTASGSKLAPAR